MIDKTVGSVEEAVAGIRDGATLMIGGFGRAGQPVELIDALIAQGAADLTIINNNAGNGDVGLAALLAKKRVRKILCSFPRQHDSWVFDGLYRAGEIEGRTYALEYPIRADVALVGAYRADRWGNLVYRETARNFGPIMAAAATTTIVQVDEIVPLGSLDPESVVTPGIFVDRVVAVGERRWLSDGAFVGGVDIEGRPLVRADSSGEGNEVDQ